MREILFRGKRKNGNKEWIYGNVNYYPNLNRWFIRLHPSSNAVPTLEDEVIPGTVGQYTGLVDKNGKKIFEGDVLLVLPRKVDNAPSVLLVVKDICETSEAFRRGAKGWEVIGNIHDNPKLLKGE